MGQAVRSRPGACCNRIFRPPRLPPCPSLSRLWSRIANGNSQPTKAPAYAARFRRIVDRVREAESRVRPGSETLARAVAWNLHKLMAYKDEYEVARLLTDPSFDEQVASTFTSPLRVFYHLHPPLLRRLGFRNKMMFGPWFRPFLRLLAKGKILRGTPLDPFGWLASRREERALVTWYCVLVDGLLERLDEATVEEAAEIASAPREIRGYEEVKRQSVERTKAWVEERLQEGKALEAA